MNSMPPGVTIDDSNVNLRYLQDISILILSIKFIVSLNPYE